VNSFLTKGYSNMASKTELESSVKELLKLSESELEGELGRRLTQTADELDRNEELTVARATGPMLDRAALQSLPDFARKTAERFLKKFNRQMYSLICDKSDPDHATVRVAAAKGTEALGYAISGALVVSFGWLPGIATVIAVIIAKRAAKATYDSFCETWKEQL
jgi:hypothetical protein